jgi:anti-anti-sigma factor
VVPDDFAIDVTGGLSWARIAVAGELDLAVTPELETALERERAARRAVILDMARVTFMDSTGLTLVLRTMKNAQENGWGFSIAAPLSKPVELVARVAGVLPMLPLLEE